MMNQPLGKRVRIVGQFAAWIGLCAAGHCLARENAPLTEIPLWPYLAPGSESYSLKEHVEVRGTDPETDRWITQVSRPTITVIPPTAQSPAQTALVICPGGGYGGLSFDKEGIEVGKWLAERGVTCFVLKYRHGGSPHQHPVPLQDVQRALQIVRSRAETLGYRSDRIGVMGFSAGGHLAASAATHVAQEDAQAVDSVQRYSSQADFQILIYPVISMDAAITHGGSRQNLLGKAPEDALVALMSNELQVTADAPPAFLVHASDDPAVPVENCLRYYRALVEHGVSAELHVFAEGGHGFGMRRKDVPIQEWPHLLENWLRSRELIP